MANFSIKAHCHEKLYLHTLLLLLFYCFQLEYLDWIYLSVSISPSSVCYVHECVSVHICVCMKNPTITLCCRTFPVYVQLWGHCSGQGERERVRYTLQTKTLAQSIFV